MTRGRTAEERLAAERRLAAELDGYRGLWVAVGGGRVLASARSCAQLRQRVALEDLDAYFKVAGRDTVTVLAAA